MINHTSLGTSRGRKREKLSGQMLGWLWKMCGEGDFWWKQKSKPSVGSEWKTDDICIFR